MPAGGGLLQLVATGKQDLFLTGNPQISFFKMVYRRHTNFATESQPMYFDGTPNFGQRITCLIPRRGDLLGRVYLDVTLPQIKDTSGNVLSYTNSIGHALIQEITFEVGEQEIDRQTGEWMEIWTQLTTPASQRDALNEMIGRIEPYYPPNLVPGSQSAGLRLLIPLQFYFCNNPGLYLPLLALQYHPVRINITLRPLQQLFWVPPPQGQDQSNWKPACTTQVDCTTQIVNMMLWGEYVYLDVEERRMFVATSHEYLIEQVQYTPPYSLTGQQTTATISVEFNHPQKEFIFVCQRDEMANRNEWFNYSNLAIGEPIPYNPTTGYNVADYMNSNAPSGRMDLIANARLQLDGYDRFMERLPQYFRLEQPYDHHTTTPVNSFIYNYCFALRPEDVQPTGTMNASRIDSIVWQINMNPVLSSPLLLPWQQRGNCHIVVYGHNYNIFRVINGFGGLLFTI
jgi:Major capsid protein N-terminus/Large eukaryotic DNA virus major capsid protein